MCRHLIYILIGIIVYFLAIALSLWLMPGADVPQTLLSMAIVCGIVSTTYYRSKISCISGWCVLLIISTMLSVGIIANVHYYTVASGGTTTHPILHNPDAATYYADALASIGDPQGHYAPINRHGYGLIISSLWQLTGISIVWPLVINMMFIMLSIIISGIITQHMLSPHINKSHQSIATTAMIMTAAVCYYLNSGTLLLKEAGICFSMAISTLGATALIYQPSNRLKATTLWASFVIGLILLIFLRHSFIIFVAIAVIVITPWQRNKIISAFFMLALCGLAWASSQILMHDYEIATQAANIINGNGISDSYFYDHPQHATYNLMVGDYFSYTVGQRILWLPISIVTQFLTPFPWNFIRDTIYGPTLAYAHIAYPWYAIGGLILFYMIIAFRKSPSQLIHITLAGIILWCIPAYLFAGTVSRYALPMLPLFIPAAVYVWYKYRIKHSFIIFCGIYALVMCAALITCHHLQHLGMQ